MRTGKNVHEARLRRQIIQKHHRTTHPPFHTYCNKDNHQSISSVTAAAAAATAATERTMIEVLELPRASSRPHVVSPIVTFKSCPMTQKKMMIPTDRTELLTLQRNTKSNNESSIANNNKKRKRTSMKVTFSAHVDESPSTKSPLHQLESVDQWDSLWYTARELAAMKEQIHAESRMLVRYLRKIQGYHHHDPAFTPTTTTTTTPCLAVSDETRGLEQRCCLERQRRKYLTIRYIVHVSARYPHNPRITAERGIVCSRWATQLALA
jgi:hypothetical protein